MNTHFDIIVIGNGMVGASLACALATSPLSIAIIDKNNPLRTEPPADGRKIALSYASRIIL
jgi:2-polyprenyl-6-methoxyphenol hydroxylase-like FAD-dependent oxidoreductase